MSHLNLQQKVEKNVLSLPSSTGWDLANAEGSAKKATRTIDGPKPEIPDKGL